MKRINEAISEKMNSFTKGQRLLAAFILEHCDKAAFMSSFELADYTGVSQSTAIRFASAMGYDSFSQFQEALQTELKFRLNTLERFEILNDKPDEDDLITEIAMTDARNIKKNTGENKCDLIKDIVTRIMLANKVFVYGQGIASAASVYLSSYLRAMLPNICCINQTGLDPLSSVINIGAGDLLICISFPIHSASTLELLSYTKDKGASVITISESRDSQTAHFSDLSLSSEYGDFGINGTLAPVISLCGSIISILARSDEKLSKRLRMVDSAGRYGKDK
jgi:DNA-binding MurR/RpiR family transcriptional regulator